MPLETPLTPESIDFEVEGSADRQSSVIAFAETTKPVNESATARATATAAASQPVKASAPSPDATSAADPSSSSPSPSRSISPSAPTSYVSSTTFPTVTATTPSVSLSQQHHHHLGRSRQPSAALDLAPHVHNPRVEAVLRRGGPTSRGRHSISPMAPDAVRAPPVELQGPPRFLKERGLTPSPRATAARAASSRRHASSRSGSHTPSPRAVSRKDEEKRRQKERGRRRQTEETASSPSRSHRSKHGEGAQKPHDHHHHHRSSSSTTTPEKHKRDRREKKEKAISNTAATSAATSDATRAAAAAATAGEARLHKRGSVVAPAYTVEDTRKMDGGAGHSAVLAPSLTVQHLEEQKRRQQEQQQQQQRQQQLEWGVRNELSSVSFQSVQSRSQPQGNGRLAVTDVRAPPPRATSPSRRAQVNRADHSTAAPQPRAKGEEGEGVVGVDLTVPLLSAHRDTRRNWPRSMAQAGEGGDERAYGADKLDVSGPPMPAAWMPSQRSAVWPTSAAAATAAHRYDSCDSESGAAAGADEVPGGVELRKAGAADGQASINGLRSAVRRSGVSPRRGRAALPADRPAASASAGPSHRFGVTTTTSPSTAGGGGAAAAAVRPARFSASPQLAGTSPIAAHSYVAQSFSSYLPGASTVLGGNGERVRRRHTRCGIEVAVLAARVAEVPPPDVLEHYDDLLRRFRQLERGTGRGGASSVDSDDDEDGCAAEVRSLFSVLVHLSLPPPTPLGDDQQTSSAATAADGGGGIGRSQVTIGDVKDEVALRTGIASSEQAIVYEAMALQDSLPVNLLISADDLEGGEDGHSLQLLCVPLVPPSVEQRRGAVPLSRRPSGATTTAVTGSLPSPSSRRGDGRGGGGATAAADSEDELQSLLLLSPSRHAAPSAAVTASAAAPSLTHREEQRWHHISGGAGLHSDAAAAGPSVRRGAVPFTLSTATTEHRTADRHAHPIQDDAPHHTSVQDGDDKAIHQHIDRLRRLYLQDHAAGSAARPVSRGDHRNGFTALPNPRDYLLEPSYEVNRTGIVEHADPHVHNLQQQLLLSQLTADGSSAAKAARVPTSESAWAVAQARGGGDGAVSAGGAHAAARSYNGSALSDALIAALPAPPVRKMPHSRDGGDGGLVVSYTAPVRAAPQPSQPSPTASAAAQRFEIAPLSSSSTPNTAAASAARSAAPISVLRHTPHTSAVFPGRAAPAARGGAQKAGWYGSGAADGEDDDDGGGVGASWLASSTRTSEASVDAAAAVESTSYTSSTLDY